MPLPLIIWGLGALATAIAVDKGAKAYGDYSIEEARRALKEAEDHVNTSMFVSDNMRVSCLNDMYARNAEIASLLEGSVDDTPIDETAIPDEVKAAYALIFGHLMSMGKATDRASFVDTSQHNKVFKTIAIATRTFPNLGPMGSFAAAAYGVHNSLETALRAKSYREQILARAEAQKIEADAVSNSLRNAIIDLEETFDQLVAPWVENSRSPPRNNNALRYAFAASLELRSLTEYMLRLSKSE